MSKRDGMLSPAELAAMLGPSGSPDASVDKEKKEAEQKKQLLAEVEQLRILIPARLSNKEKSLIDLRKAVVAVKSKRFSLEELKKYKVTLEIFTKLREELSALGRGADVGQRIIEVLTALGGQDKVLPDHYISKINNDAVLEHFAIPREEDPILEEGADAEAPEFEGDPVEPIPGVTKMYLPPKKDSDETAWKEVLFVRSESTEEKGETFVVKFSPNGQEIRLSRKAFRKTPEEGVGVDSRFSDSMYYQERLADEEPIPGVTKMYLPPKKDSDETAWKEVLFVRSESTEEKGETFVVKFSPNGQEIRLSRKAFRKTPEEGVGVDSRFSDSKYYEIVGDHSETRTKVEKKEFTEGETVYFLVAGGPDIGKYREGKIIVDGEGRKKVWFGSFDKNGEKKLNNLRLSDLLTNSGLEELRSNAPETEVVPFVEQQARPPFNPDESGDPLVRPGTEPVPPSRTEIRPSIDVVGTIVESFGRKFTIGQDVKFLKAGKEVSGTIKSFNPTLESLTIVYQEMDAGALVTREKPFVGDEDIESIIVLEPAAPVVETEPRGSFVGSPVKGEYYELDGQIFYIKDIDGEGKDEIHFGLVKDGKITDNFFATREEWKDYLDGKEITLADIPFSGDLKIDHPYTQIDGRVFTIKTIDTLGKGLIKFSVQDSSGTIKSQKASRAGWKKYVEANHIIFETTTAPVDPAPDVQVPPTASDVLSEEDINALLAWGRSPKEPPPKVQNGLSPEEIDALLAQVKEEERKALLAKLENERIEAERLRGLPRFSFVYDHGKYTSPKDVPASEKERSFETKFGAFSIISDYGGEGSKYKGQNEDSYCLVPTPDGGFAVVVIDGAGGSSNGLDASRSMVVSFEHQLSSGISIRDSFFAAHQHLSDLNKQQGTDAYGVACALKISSEGQVDLGSVGDSKVLTIRDKKVLKEGTTDFENVANSSVKLGYIQPQEYFQSPVKSRIENAIGSGKMKWDASNERHFRGETGDRVILASDGLWDVVSEYEVLELSESSRTAEELRKKLFDLVYSRYNDGNPFTINFDGTIQVPMDYNYGDNITIAVFDLNLDKISRPAKTSEPLPLSQDELDALLAQGRGTPEPSPRPATSRFDGVQNPDVFRGNPQIGEIFRIHGKTKSGNTVDFTVMVTAIGSDSLTLLEYGEEKPFQENIDWWNSWATKESMDLIDDQNIKAQFDTQIEEYLRAEQIEEENLERFKEVPGVKFRGDPQVGETFLFHNVPIKIISIGDDSLTMYRPQIGRMSYDSDDWNGYVQNGDIRLAAVGQFEREIANIEKFIGSPGALREYLIQDASGAVSDIISIVAITDTEIIYKDLLHQSSPEQHCDPREWKYKVGSCTALEDCTGSYQFIKEEGKTFEVKGKTFEVGKKYYCDQTDGTQEEVTIESFQPSSNFEYSKIHCIKIDGTKNYIYGKNAGILSESRRPVPGDTRSTVVDASGMLDQTREDESAQYAMAYNYFEGKKKASFSQFGKDCNLESSDAGALIRRLLKEGVLVQKKKWFGLAGFVFEFIPESERSVAAQIEETPTFPEDPAFTENLPVTPDMSGGDTSLLDAGTAEPFMDSSPESTEIQEEGEVAIDLNFEFISPGTLQKYLREFSIAIMNENQDAVNSVTAEVQYMFDDLTDEDFQKFKFAGQYKDLADFQKMWKEQGAPMFCSMLDEMTSHNLQSAINANPDVKKALLEIHKDLPFKKALKRGLLWGGATAFGAATLMRLVTTALPGIVATAAFAGTIVLREKERHDFEKNQKQVDTKKESTKKSVNDSFLEFQTDKTMQERLDNIAKRIAFRKGNPKARQEVYQESLDDMIFSLQGQIREKELALAQISVTDTGARTPLETEILGLKREKIMLKADKALNIHKNNRGGVSDLTYNGEALKKIENSAFFSNAWNEATHGDKRLSKQFTSKWGDRVWGHLVAGGVNAAAAVTVSEALPHVTGVDSFFGRFGIRGLVASVVKGGEAGLLSRRNVEASQLRKIREAQQMLGSKNKDQLDAADKKMQAAQKVATWKDTTKAVASRGIVAGVAAGTVGSAVDYGRELLFTPEQAPVQDPTLTESTEAQQPKYEGTLLPESTPQEKLAAAYGAPTQENAQVIEAAKQNPAYDKYAANFARYSAEHNDVKARANLLFMLKEGDPSNLDENIQKLYGVLPEGGMSPFDNRKIIFLKDPTFPNKLFVKIAPDGIDRNPNFFEGNHLIEVTPDNAHAIFTETQNVTKDNLLDVLKTLEHTDAPGSSSIPQVEAPASAPTPELSPDGTTLSEKVLADIKYIHSYKSEYLDKLVNSIGEKSQDIVTSAHSKLKIIEDLIRSRAEAGNTMSSEEIMKELQTRSTSDEWLLLNSDNTCNSDHPIVVDKNSFAFFDKITEKRFFHNDPGKIYTLQDREHLRIHDISTNTDKVVSLRYNGRGKLDILEELR